VRASGDARDGDHGQALRLVYDSDQIRGLSSGIIGRTPALTQTFVAATAMT